MPDSRTKRDASPLRLAQYNATSPVTVPANVSTPSLLTADNTDDFPIPYTHFSLIFGNLGPSLHPWDLETILIAARAEIEAEIEIHGRNALLPSTEYSMDLVSLQLWVKRVPWVTANLAWAEMAIIIEGLWLYILGGRHDREAFFDFVNTVTREQAAFGFIGKPHRPLELTSSTPFFESA